MGVPRVSDVVVIVFNAVGVHSVCLLRTEPVPNDGGGMSRASVASRSPRQYIWLEARRVHAIGVPHRSGRLPCSLVAGRYVSIGVTVLGTPRSVTVHQYAGPLILTANVTSIYFSADVGAERVARCRRGSTALCPKGRVRRRDFGIGRENS